MSGFLFLAAVALAPLPFGLTAPVPIAGCCLILAVSLLTADVSQVRAAHLLRITPAVVAAAAYFGFALVQMSGTILPQAAVWGEASAVLGASLQPHPSWTATGPWISLGPALALTLAFLRGAVYCTDPRKVRRLLVVVAVSGMTYAVYGILAQLTDPNTLLWRPKTAYLGVVTGTFVNRNTAATYWGSCCVVACALFLDMFARMPPDSSWREQDWRRIALPLLSLIACLTATAMTGSRAGLLLTLLVLTVVAFLSFARPRRGARMSLRVIGPAVLAMLVLGQLIGGTVSDRIRLDGLVDDRRLAAYRSTYAMIVDHPWQGVGIGGFAAAFPRYRTGELGSAGIWDWAHSTPLELAAEAGLPLTILIIACCVLIFYFLLTGCLVRRRDLCNPIAGLGVGLLGVLHSCIDFSLQIAGYGVVFAAIVACGVAQSVPTRSAGTFKVA